MPKVLDIATYAMKASSFFMPKVLDIATYAMKASSCSGRLGATEPGMRPARQVIFGPGCEAPADSLRIPRFIAGSTG